MAVSVSAQTLTFLASCVLGMILGALYDMFRIIRMVRRPGSVSVFFQDLLFLLICTAVTFLFLLSESSGSIRLFILEGEILGAVFYYFTLGVLTMRAADAVIKALEKFGRLLGVKVMPPVRRGCDRIGGSIRRKKEAADGLFKKKNKLLKMRLKLLRTKLYNILCRRTRKNRREPAKNPKIKRRRIRRREKTT